MMTVADLRRALEGVPDDTVVIAVCEYDSVEPDTAAYRFEPAERYGAPASERGRYRFFIGHGLCREMPPPLESGDN
jgi:hypothetical protein